MRGESIFLFESLTIAHTHTETRNATNISVTNVGLTHTKTNLSLPFDPTDF